MNRSIVPGAAGPTRMEMHQIDRSDSRYPDVLTARLGTAAPAGVAAGRARLRAELDGLVAVLYGLTDSEFAHVLSTFPLVPDAVKASAQTAFRDAAEGRIH